MQDIQRAVAARSLLVTAVVTVLIPALETLLEIISILPRINIALVTVGSVSIN